MKLFLSVTIALLCACSSPKTASDGKAVTGATSTETPLGGLRALTQVGVNTRPYISPDGRYILYQSSLRPQHMKAQIYILDLRTKRERRITFNDGDDSPQGFSPDGKRILYSSTTDEIKEHEAGASTSDLPSAELYSANVDGSAIHRLTKSIGYDADAGSTAKHIYFTSVRDGNLELYLMEIDGRAQRRLTNNKTKDFCPTPTLDGKQVVWISENTDRSNSQVVLAESGFKNQKQLTKNNYRTFDVAWNSQNSRIVFSASRLPKDPAEIFSVAIDGTCLKKLVLGETVAKDSSGHGLGDRHPQFDKTGSKLVFSSERSGRSQIYMTDLQEPAACSNEAP